MSKQSQLALCSVLILCVGIISAFAPGHLDGDALGMLYWVKTNTYSDWYPLLLPYLLKTFVALGIGPVGVLACQVLIVGICTYAIAAFFWRPVVAAILSCGLLLWPPVLGYLGAITSHAILTACLLCGFTGLLYLTRPLTPKQRLALFVLSFFALALATIARQNSAAFTLPVFFAWATLVIRRVHLLKSSGFLRFATACVVSCTIVIGVMVCGKYVLTSLLHPVHTEPAEPLFLYDMSALSLRAHHLLLDRKHFPNHTLDDLQKIFRENDPDILIFHGWDNVRPLRGSHDPADRSELMHTWAKSIAQYPGYYFTERYHMFRGLLGLDFRSPPAVPFHPGIDGNKLGYHIANPRADTFVVTYLKIFQNSIVDRPFVYFLLLFAAVGVIPFMLRRATDVRLVLLSMATGSLLNLAGYFFASPSTLLRYIWPSIVSNMIIVAVVAPYCVSFLRRREWFLDVVMDVVLDRRIQVVSNGPEFETIEPVNDRTPGEVWVRRFCGRVRDTHLLFDSLGRRLSMPEFLRFDAWAIWFYTVCLTAFLVASILNLNGSATSIYHSGYARGASVKPFIGQPHWIRMDEWDFQTPAILNQADRLHPFRVKSTPLGAHSVALVGNIPVAHISTIFRPQFWGFFFLSKEYAFAVYWQFKAFILLTGIFSWLLLLTRSTLWAATGSLWYFFSSFTQWAYSWPSLLPEMIGSVCFAMVLACYLTIGRSRLGLILAGTGFATCVINFGLCAYLPHMLPLVWLALLFFAGWLLANRKKIWSRDELTRQRIAVIAVSIGLVAVVAVFTAFQARIAIEGIADTVYPGKRLYAGGTLTVQWFLVHFFNWFNSEGHFPLILGNVCEAAGFLWLAPVTVFSVDRLRLSRFKKISLVALSCTGMLLLAWLLVPLPPWVGSMFALNRTGQTRPMPALGLANVAIVAVMMSSFREDVRRQMRTSVVAIIRKTAGVLLLVAMLLILTNRLFGGFYSAGQVLFAVTFTTLLITLMMHGSRRLLPILLVVPSALVFGMINPVERGLAVFTSSAMYKFVRTNQDFRDSKWIVFSDELWMPGFLTATGCQVYDGLHYLPDIDHFWLFAARGLDVNVFNQDGYLLAHPIGPAEKTSVQVIGPGWIRWNVSPSDPIFKQLGVKYVAFDQKPADDVAARLVPLSVQPIDNYWLYRIP